MNVLVTGGAGYVGSHAAKRLARDGHDVWIFDNLSQGHRNAVKADRLICGELTDQSLLREILQAKRIEAVMHFAGSAIVHESVASPAKYYQNNVVGTLSLLEAMRTSDVMRIVFSSSCAVYGHSLHNPIAEDAPPNPVSPYGITKLVIERVLSEYADAYGFAYAALRYFNASGASSDGDLGEDHRPETHLIPSALQVALGQRRHIIICGDDYPTPDRTCIRDYIHVDDLAIAHLQALERLQPGKGFCLNLGTGRGFSVREVIDLCRAITGHSIPVVSAPRRPCDPPELVADSRQAKAVLGWTPEYVDLRSIIETAWRWHCRHPYGY